MNNQAAFERKRSMFIDWLHATVADNATIQIAKVPWLLPHEVSFTAEDAGWEPEDLQGWQCIIAPHPAAHKVTPLLVLSLQDIKR